ncbi:MAG: hypothetical protein HQ559_18595 [Lentisphaerae bacterium]|nr:hypothetical protein [Lentisphaerota bacterium]
MSGTSPSGTSRLRSFLRTLGRNTADLAKILIAELTQFVVQVAVPALLLIILAGGLRPAGDAEDEGRFLHFDTDHLIGTPLVSDEPDEAEEVEVEPEAAEPETAGLGPLLDPQVWRNRVAFIYPSLRDTTMLLLSGLVASTLIACLLVIPALRSRSPGMRMLLAAIDEFGLLLCCLPVFVAGFIIRLKIPYESRTLYYCMAALTLGVGNLTLAEIVQMLRSRLEEETRMPYFDLIEVRGFTTWRRWVHRIKPYTRAVLLSLRSKVPILFSSVVIIEIILSLPVGGLSPIEKGLGLVAKEAAEAGDGITLLWVIVVVAIWIRAFSFLAETATYFGLWNPKRE